MSYLSHLLIDLGDNPDRPRPARLWLRNRYHVHQRLCMAFPSAKLVIDDPFFLSPFSPDNFDSRQVKTARDTDSGFLFRIDPQPGSKAVILVQSAIAPNWQYAFQNTPLMPFIQMREETRSFTIGERFRFRLEANPTKRLREGSLHPNGEKINSQWVGKRVPVPTDQMDDWLTRRATGSGFLVEKITNFVPGYAFVGKSSHSIKENLPRSLKDQLRAVRYEGILEVTDSDKMTGTIISGIGPAKAFGFGLLSLVKMT